MRHNPGIISFTLALFCLVLFSGFSAISQASIAAGHSRNANPTALDGLRMHLLPEPLIPVGKTPLPSDDSELQATLERFQQRRDVEDYTALTAYLKTHVDSPYRVALWTNLGILYYHGGYFSLAIDAWEHAWAEGRHDTGL
jgi:hypothetical protein